MLVHQRVYTQDQNPEKGQIHPIILRIRGTSASAPSARCAGPTWQRDPTQGGVAWGNNWNNQAAIEKAENLDL